MTVLIHLNTTAKDIGLKEHPDCEVPALGRIRERDVAPWQERSLMVRWVDGSIFHGGPIELFLRSIQCFTTGVTKAVVCAILSVGWCI